VGGHPVAFLDVFAERPLAGNGLAVVNEADGISDEVMAAFAGETRLSETTFVQSPEDDGADYRNRIFIPGAELPFAGHPSLGTAVAVARWRRQQEASFVQQTGTGLQPVDVRREQDGSGGWESWRATMLQGEPELGDELDPAAALAAAGLEPADADPELRPGLASTGLLTAVVPVADRDSLTRARLDPEAVAELLAPADDGMLYLVRVEPDSGRAWARSFAPEASVGEDPATGSSAGAFCAWVAARTGCERLTISQGVEMGRPSVLEVEMEGDGVRVGGSVIPLIDGRVLLP
jgi:trans-2,3-dihydro-3-hydroxyanthranilate isomerase